MDKIYKVSTENLDIGRITICENGDSRFDYTEEFKISDHKPFFDFPDKTKSYSNHYVSIFLVNRLPVSELTKHGVLSFKDAEIMSMLKNVPNSTVVVEEVES